MGNVTQIFKSTKKATAILASAVALLFTIAFLAGVFKPSNEAKWEEVTYTDENGDVHLKPKYQQELDKKILELGDVEQYVLRARGNGNYTCYTCSDSTYFLKKDEVWKYGVTRKKEKGRYKAAFLRENNLYYEIQHTGNLYECAIQEQVKLRLYPVLPENLARVKELRRVFPPGNHRLD